MHVTFDLLYCLNLFHGDHDLKLSGTDTEAGPRARGGYASALTSHRPPIGDCPQDVPGARFAGRPSEDLNVCIDAV
ncbi:hypothetical protein GCM10010270_76320 [Streptomyces violaceus]|nr:hypothetical protein GCM10010270_76320 [Streptomyces janthinus]